MKKIHLPTGITVIAVLASLALHSLWRGKPGHPTESTKQGPIAPGIEAPQSVSPTDITSHASAMETREALTVAEKAAPETAPVIAQLKQVQRKFDQTLSLHQALREKHTALILAGDEKSAEEARYMEQKMRTSSEKLFKLSRKIYELTQEVSRSLTEIMAREIQGEAS